MEKESQKEELKKLISDYRKEGLTDKQIAKKLEAKRYAWEVIRSYLDK